MAEDTDDTTPAEPYRTFATKDEFTAHFDAVIAKKTAAHAKKADALKAKIAEYEAAEAERAEADTAAANGDNAMQRQITAMERKLQATMAQAEAAQAAQAATLKRHRNSALRQHVQETISPHVSPTALKHATDILISEGRFSADGEDEFVFSCTDADDLPVADPAAFVQSWVEENRHFARPSAGGAGSSGSGPPKNGTGIPGWDKMSAEDRLNSLPR